MFFKKELTWARQACRNPHHQIPSSSSCVSSLCPCPVCCLQNKTKIEIKSNKVQLKKGRKRPTLFLVLAAILLFLLLLAFLFFLLFLLGLLATANIMQMLLSTERGPKSFDILTRRAAKRVRPSSRIPRSIVCAAGNFAPPCHILLRVLLGALQSSQQIPEAADYHLRSLP